MPRPSKTVNAIQGHRTKAELELRKSGEESLKTGKAITKRPDIKKDKFANKEFNRIKSLFEKLNKNDDLYSAIINRYCLIQSEVVNFEKKIAEVNDKLVKLEKEYIVGEIEAEVYFKIYDGLQKSIMNYDRQVMAKRKMLFDIEKENLMTVASGLRSIPKTPIQTEENPLIKALMEDD